MQTVKQLRKTLLCAALCAAPLTAAQAAADLDLYYTPYAQIKLKDSGGNELDFDEGDGYGAKGKFGITDSIFVSGEYEKNEYDDVTINGTPIIPGGPGPILNVDQRVEQYRAGLGFNVPTTPFYVLGEYVGIESKTRVDNGTTASESHTDKSEGWGAHLGAKGKVLNDYLTLNAEVGYLDVGNADGLEALAGFAVNVSKHVGLFADYRYTSLTANNDSDVDVRLGEARVGARISF